MKLKDIIWGLSVPIFAFASAFYIARLPYNLQSEIMKILVIILLSEFIFLLILRSVIWLMKKRKRYKL